MSAARRQRDSLAPSLFPFLAVLLCTMGSLVLILMLIVSAARASTERVVQETRDRNEEVQSQLDLAASSYQRQLDEGRITLDKKRILLQNLETHIQELLDELEDLQEAHQLLSESDAERRESSEIREQITELEKQLADALSELETKRLEKPKNKKPVFAIIPYQGRNGTHRRPIYLECGADGIRLQPEGILISTEDLQPPHGPGNPLDAALRTVRAEFAPTNGAVTSTAYPLLIVRPSGIRTYALARSAMSSWDDQFGYELIDEALELTFPPSNPKLPEKVANAISLARERQAALVKAMPRKYRQREQFGDFGPSTSGGSGQSGGSSRNPYGGSGGFAFGGRDSNRPFGSRAGGAGRDPREFAGGFAGRGAGTSAADSLLQLENQLGAASGSLLSDPPSLRSGGAPSSPSAGSAGPGFADATQGYASSQNQSGQESSFFGDSGGGTSSRNSGSSASNGGGGQSASSSAAGLTSSNPQQGGAEMPLPSAIASALQGAIQPGATDGAIDGDRGGSTAQQQPGGPGQFESSGSSQQAADAAAGGPMLNADLSNRRNDTAAPVARSQGRNWAWSQGPPTQTPVVRSIKLQILPDRWILKGESGRRDQVVPLDTSVEVRAIDLAKLVRQRIDSWGLALSGGYWKPELVVDVAPDAQWRFVQLQQLLDGSGLDIQRRR